MLCTKRAWTKVAAATLALGLALSASAAPARAQAETFCPPGQNPEFQMGFAMLKAHLGDPMGDPLECEHYDGQGNAYQRTTTGLAFFDKSTGALRFTSGDQPDVSVQQQTTPTPEVTSTPEATAIQESTPTPSQAAVVTETVTTAPAADTGVEAPAAATAVMHDAAGSVVGTARFTETASGLQLDVEIAGLAAAAPGEHGIHFHQVGRCTPDFAVAGHHFNPAMAEHGLQNPAGPHAGDLPNITFGEGGSAAYTTTTSLVSLTTGERALLAADGTSLLIHAMTDDQVTDPDGRSGERIACGVLMAGGAPPAQQTPAPPIQGSNNPPEQRTATLPRIEGLQAPAGFDVGVFAEGLANVRMMAQAADGTVYVTRRMQGDVLALRDSDGDGRADPPIVAASGLDSVHGILIRDSQIYLATPTVIYVGSLAGDGTVQGLTALVSDLPEGAQHPNRTLAFGPDGLLYVSIGSPCNACGIDDPEYAAILQVQPDGSTRTIYADGLRNTIGWGWHPATGQMWGMDHGSDWRGDNQPPEELNLLVQGTNYGWPYCFADRQVDPYIPGEAPGVTKPEFCAQSAGPALTYQAHSAPIGMVFYTGAQFPEAYRNDAIVAMRGSWNRQQPVGYEVVRIDFNEAGQPVGFEDFVTGWLIENGRAQFGRVAGLLVLQDGSLLISDDTNGMIYRVTFTGGQ